MLRLLRDGHEVVAWVRSLSQRDLLGAEVETSLVGAADDELTRTLERCDAVVNLAGAPVVGRWTTARKKVLFDSRVGVTSRLVRAMSRASTKPRVLISGSAIGYYGDRGGEPVDENTGPGAGFLAGVAVAWEAAARAAEPLGVRVVMIRTGVVLGREGGVLARLVPIFRLGLGGPLGTGNQYVSWVHLDDVVSVIAAALVDERYAGPINMTAPNAVTNAELTRVLGRALGRPTVVRVPAMTLRLVLGQSASMLLEGQRVEPARLLALGYPFELVDLAAALADVLACHADIHRLGRGATLPVAGASYLEERKPSYELTARTVLDAPPERAFSFFTHPENLGPLTPSQIGLAVETAPSEMSPGARVDLRLRSGRRIPLRWTTCIESWEPGRRFVDSQLRGPYSSWWHEHSFRAADGRTVMTDHVLYSVPFGILGRLANRLFVAPSLRRIFSFRRDAIRLRFGGPA